MATNQIMLLTFSLFFFLLSSAFADTYTPPTPAPPPVKKTIVVVEGMVYCQSCKNYGSWSLTDAETIASAKISVICKNHREQISFYRVYETDKYGYFYALLDGFKIEHGLLDHPLHSCHVKLVSSPLENCNHLTNINSGMYGASLRYEEKRVKGKGFEAVIYAAGPLAFRPSSCPTTSTTTYQP